MRVRIGTLPGSNRRAKYAQQYRQGIRLWLTELTTLSEESTQFWKERLREIESR